MRLGILITWSPPDIDEGIHAILIQIYPILLSTLFLIGRNQLYVFDANFALTLTSSPLTIYLVVASICDLLGIKTGLYKQINSHRFSIRIPGALVIFLWFGLSVTLTVSDSAFIDSGICGGSTFGDWLFQLFYHFLVYVVYAGVPSDAPPTGAAPIILGSPFAVLLFRGRSQVVAEARRVWEGQSKLWRWSRGPWILARCAWYVPIVVDPLLPKSYANKAFYQSQPQSIYILTIHIPRCQLGIQRHRECQACIEWICAVLWSGVATSKFVC